MTTCYTIIGVYLFAELSEDKFGNFGYGPTRLEIRSILEIRSKCEICSTREDLNSASAYSGLHTHDASPPPPGQRLARAVMREGCEVG